MITEEDNDQQVPTGAKGHQSRSWEQLELSEDKQGLVAVKALCVWSFIAGPGALSQSFLRLRQ